MTPRRRTALVIALVLAVASGALQACGGGDAEAATFRREPVGTRGPNPFMAGVDTAPATLGTASVGDPVASTSTTVAAPTAAPITLPPGSAGTVAGQTVGLYGGSMHAAVCDATKMAAFLSSHPEEAAAWAGVLGIRTADIARYVSLLTPALLRTDTAVTNHGLRDGKATSVPAVLQAGTAVFVDDRGVPVVKCSCGNPLTPPPDRRGASFTGTSWRAFRPSSVSTVRRSPARLDDLTLVDAHSRTAFTRPIGTDGDADVPYVPPPGGSSGDPTTTTTAPDGAERTTSTTPGTTTTSTTSATTTTSTPTAGGDTATYDARSSGTGGVCAGVPGAAFELRVEGGTITFSSAERGPIRPDGSFDFTVDGAVGGGMGGSLRSHFTGRVDQGPPWELHATREDTVTSPTGRTDTCIATYTGTRRDVPAAATTTTEATTTTGPTTVTTAPAAPTEQTWYFAGTMDEASPGCEALGITVVRGDEQRIRVRDGGPDGHNVTILGRPSRTFPVGDDDRFDGVLIAQGAGDPDQMQVTVGGGPVPYLGVTRARAFPYGSLIGEAASVPGTFHRTFCTISSTARPRS